MKKTLLIIAVACMTLSSLNAQKLYTFGTDVESADKQAYNVSLTLSDGAILNSLGSTSAANGVWIQPTQLGKWLLVDGTTQIDAPVGRIALKDSQNATRTANVAVPVLSGQVIQILYASSGAAVRTLGVALDGTQVATFASLATGNLYSLGTYTATANGTLTIYSTGSGMYVGAIGVGVSIPQNTTSVKNIFTDKGVSINNTEIVNIKGLALEVYNVLGKKVASATTSISTINLQKGIYIVRIAGIKEAMKFSK